MLSMSQTETTKGLSLTQSRIDKGKGRKRSSPVSTIVQMSPSDNSDDHKGSMNARSRVHGQGTQGSSAGYMTKIVYMSAELKCMIAHTTLGDYQRDIDALKAKYQGTIDDYRASIIRFCAMDKDLVKERHVYQKQVASINDNPQYCHRAMLCYHYGYLKRIDCRLQNLFFEIIQQRAKKKKLLANIVENMSRDEMVQPIDVREIKLLCNSAMTRMKELKYSCGHLKSLANQCSRMHHRQIRKLDEANLASKEMDCLIERRRLVNRKIAAKGRQYFNLQFKEIVENREFHDKLRYNKVPSQSDFMRAINTNRQLDKQMSTNERKMRIAKMCLKEHERAWSRLKLTND